MPEWGSNGSGIETSASRIAISGTGGIVMASVNMVVRTFRAVPMPKRSMKNGLLRGSQVRQREASGRLWAKELSLP